jgi:hypothetical protein
MITLSINELFRYANDYARQHAGDGRGTVYPTFKEASNHFGVSMRLIEQICDEHSELGYLGAATARGRLSWGAGARRADYLEAYA